MLMRHRGESPCEHLEWDSRHFGLRIARVSASALLDGHAAEIDDWRRQEQVDCLYLLAPLDHLPARRLAETLGFHLIDVRITLERTTAGGQPPTFAATRPFCDADLPRLVHLAGTLHRDSRFFVDTGFPEARSRAMFERWMMRACSEPAYHVIVAEVDGGPAGYVACERKHDGSGQIQLVGVDVTAQRRGLATQMLNDAMAHFARHGVSHVTVVTQATNLAALRLYESLGFLTRAHDAWYHWWAQESSPADGTLRP